MGRHCPHADGTVIIRTMAERDIINEFDPLAVPETSGSTAGLLNKQTESSETTVSSKLSVVSEFDPLAPEKTESQYTSQCNDQPSATSDSSLQPSLIVTSQVANIDVNLSSVNVLSRQLCTGNDVPNGAAKASSSSRVSESTELKKVVSKDETVSGSALMGTTNQSRSDHIGAEISKIDSVLKALNMGQFDVSFLTGTVSTQSLQKSQPNQAEDASAATHSTGLDLIGQLGSGDSGSSSDSGDSSSDSSDDSVELVRELHNVNDSGSDGEQDSNRGRKAHRENCPMTKGEVDYRTLPTPARCDIPFPDRGTLMPIGKVSHLAEKLIVIEALPGTPPFDEGTVIWSKEKKSMARIFETFGPVKSPVYSVMVESSEQAVEMGLSPGQLVYVVPSNMELTKYIFTQQLMKQKGSDASWKDDHEVPTQFQDYSDDESEKAANKGKKQTGKRSRQASATFQSSSHTPVHPTNTSSHPGESFYPTSAPTVSAPPISAGYSHGHGHPSGQNMPIYPSHYFTPHSNSQPPHYYH